MREPSDSPVRRRRPNWRPRFLEVIRSTGNVRLAAREAGIDRSTPYVRARRDEAFAAAWQAANDDAIDLLEAEAWRRAFAGSHALLMFLLRAHRPERYRDTLDIHVDFRREAERIAARFGLNADEVLADANRRAQELRQ
jgi:hypothetical protein